MAWLTTSGYWRTSAGSDRAAFDDACRTPVTCPAGYPSKIARSSAKAIFGAVKGERHPELDDRPPRPQPRDDAVLRRVDRRHVPGAHPGQSHPVWPGDVHDPPAGHMAREGPLGLFLDAGPGGGGDWGELAVQVVHGCPLREPIPRVPGAVSLIASVTGGAVPGPGRSSRKSAAGAKNSPPVMAVEKSRRRSVVPGGLPRNMFWSICSVTD